MKNDSFLAPSTVTKYNEKISLRNGFRNNHQGQKRGIENGIKKDLEVKGRQLTTKGPRYKPLHNRLLQNHYKGV
jgi:hypothetical protein